LWGCIRMAILGPEYFYKRVTTAALEWDNLEQYLPGFGGLGDSSQ